MKKFVTNNKFFKWCFSWIHPDIGVRLGQFLSREKKIMSAKKDIGDVENQWLTQYCRKKLETNNYNYFNFFQINGNEKMTLGRVPYRGCYPQQ